MAPERIVPLLRTDFSILDVEFNSIRERFEQEMRKMEDEMNKFRSELLAREQQSISKSTTSSKETITRVTESGTSSQKSEFYEEKQHSSQNSTQNGAFGSGDNFKSHVSTGGTHKSELRTWLDGFESPLIKDGNDGKELKLRFDVSQYTPEEIVVKTVDNKLQVQAKHEEKSENRSVYREYNREFLLPKGTNPELIKSSLSKDGVLTVEAPLPAIAGAGERMIPIDKF